MRERESSYFQSFQPTLSVRGSLFAVLLVAVTSVTPQLSNAAGSGVIDGSVSESSSQTTSTGIHIPTEQEVADFKRAVDDAPSNAKAHYALGRALRLTGKNSQAVVEYLDASQLDPALYVSYHELALSKARPEQLDEAIERLKLLQVQRPKDLLLCIALSELLEQRDELYPAAKVLSDLVYSNSVPAKYLARVKARIHFLINKNKDEQTTRKTSPEEADADGAPLPLPESSLRRSLSASQLKDAKVMQNFGHAPLLP